MRARCAYTSGGRDEQHGEERREPPHSGEGRRRRRRAPTLIGTKSVKRAGRDHPHRPCEPAHRPARRLRRGRRLHHGSDARHPEERHPERRAHLSGADHLQGQPVERQPCRRGRVGADPARQGRSADRAPARPTPPTRWPIRQRSTRPLRPHQLPVAAVFLRPQGRSEEGLHLDLSCSSGAWRT